MTRPEAIAKAQKPQALADRPGTPAEGQAARNAMERLMRAHELTPTDLDTPAPTRTRGRKPQHTNLDELLRELMQDERFMQATASMFNFIFREMFKRTK